LGDEWAETKTSKQKPIKKKVKKSGHIMRFWIAKFPKKIPLIDIDWHLYEVQVGNQHTKGSFRLLLLFNIMFHS
jgi:hypothetical protein